MEEKTMAEWERVLGAPVIRVVPYQRNWRITTPNGEWVLKKVRYPEHLRWWVWIDRELRMRGFRAMPTIRTDGYRWLFSHWISGRPATYREPADILKTSRLLAQYHLAGQGLFTPPVTTASYPLLNRLDARLHAFSELLREAQGMEGEAGELIRSFGFRYYGCGVRARSRLDRLPFKELIDWNRTCRFLTHRDLASHNVMTDGEGRFWLIDFETADYDCQLGDLWQLLSRSGSEQEWNPVIFREAVAEYESVRPLSSLEKRLLKELLAFPNEFYRESLGLIRKKQGYRPDKTLPYLRKITGSFTRWKQFLRELSHW